VDYWTQGMSDVEQFMAKDWDLMERVEWWSPQLHWWFSVPPWQQRVDRRCCEQGIHRDINLGWAGSKIQAWQEVWMNTLRCLLVYKMCIIISKA
jgi:hypothetical protein